MRQSCCQEPNKLTFCAGVVNIWGRDPATTVTATRTLLESFPGRFMLGLGISHREQVEPRGHSYMHPVDTMRTYLAAMDTVPFVSPLPQETAATEPVPRFLGVLGPKMTKLAAERADGIQPVLTVPSTTAQMRETLGADIDIFPMQPFILTDDAVRGKAHSSRLPAMAFGDNELPIESLPGKGS